jgi:uncharacterized protein (DUF2252 family)
VLLAVGDLHVENFGVWRDSRGGFVWGVNDFDDACQLPFTSDLVRLATSVMLAVFEAEETVLLAKQVCAFLVEGYRASLRSGGMPILRESTLGTCSADEAPAGSPRDVLEKDAESEKESEY